MGQLSEAPDDELMRAAASGNLEAVGVLYDRYSHVLFPIAKRITGGSEDAEDVLHDVFVSLPERAKSYTEARGTVAAWLVIVTRNLALDRVRRRGRRNQIDRAVVDAPPPPSTPETRAELSEHAAKLRTVLGVLSDVQRETLDLAFFEGLSYPEIAERQGVPLGTVKTRIARALAELRRVLAPS